MKVKRRCNCCRGAAPPWRATHRDTSAAQARRSLFVHDGCRKFRAGLRRDRSTGFARPRRRSAPTTSHYPYLVANVHPSPQQSI